MHVGEDVAVDDPVVIGDFAGQHEHKLGKAAFRFGNNGGANCDPRDAKCGGRNSGGVVLGWPLSNTGRNPPLLSLKLLKRWLLKLGVLLLAVTGLSPLAVLLLLVVGSGLESSAEARVEVVNEMGPPTSIGESADTDGEGLSSGCWTNFNPGDGVPALFDPDCVVECICVLEWGRSGSESTLGLIGGALGLRISSSSASPVMSGLAESRLSVSNLSFNNCGSDPSPRFRCSSFSRSALRHLARRFWNQT